MCTYIAHARVSVCTQHGGLLLGMNANRMGVALHECCVGGLVDVLSIDDGVLAEF